MTDKELLQEALEALTYVGDKDIYSDTIDALRARLAQPEPAECDGGQCGIGGYCKQCPKTQPEQEPFEYWNAVEGWVKIDEVRQHFDTTNCGTIYKHEGEGRIPLYAEPPQREWVGLTDEELHALHFELKVQTMGGMNTLGMYRILEKALREKNNG